MMEANTGERKERPKRQLMWKGPAVHAASAGGVSEAETRMQCFEA